MNRVNKIKLEIMHLESKINIYNSIISKFNQLPKDIQDGINAGMYKGDFISNNQRDLDMCMRQLENLNKSLEEIL